LSRHVIKLEKRLVEEKEQIGQTPSDGKASQNHLRNFSERVKPLGAQRKKETINVIQAVIPCLPVKKRNLLIFSKLRFF